MGLGGTHDFGRFHLDTESRVLTRDGVVVPIAPRTFDLLVILVRSKGRLLSKDELLGIIWGDVNVEEASLAFQVSSLRKLLGDEGSAWIETVPKHGYRFTAPLTESKPTQGTRQPTLRPPTQAKGVRISKVWAAAVSLSALALAVGWLEFPRRNEHLIVSEARITPLTSYPGMETHPSLSPDGTQVVFSWEGEPRKDPDIYVQTIGQGRPVPLTTDPRPEFGPVWSPDGQWIAFCRETESGNEIVMVPARGGGPEKVIASPSKAWIPVCPNRRPALSWFPSSDALAAVGYVTSDSPRAIYVVPVDGGPARAITHPPGRAWGDELPSVSSDGRYVAFTRALDFSEWGEAEIYVLALNAGKSAAGEPAAFMSRPSPAGADFGHLEPIWGLGWIAGRNELIFSRRGLWIASLAGRRAVKLIPTAGYTPGPFSVSRDGARFVFSTRSKDWSDDCDIWEIPGPASGVRERQQAAAGKALIESTRLDTNPQYSPNGSRIAFTSERTGKEQIWVADADGSTAMQLTHRDAWFGSPRWSPDGRYIAYDGVDGPDRKGDVYVMPAGGGAERRVTPEASHEQVPSWSRDGRWIYYESDRTGVFQLWKTEFPTGRTVQVTFHGGAAASESPDGQWLYYGKRGETGIWRRSVAGGEEERVTEHGYAMQWGIYDQGGCLMTPLLDEVRVECFSFKSNQLSVITRFPNGGRVRFDGGPAFCVSPDGKRILYTRVGREEGDLMLIDNFVAVTGR
jgi:Tol biopolymer transport system component/DNA-binding winged helix-turn-helix (wHTH) protein